MRAYRAGPLRYCSSAGPRRGGFWQYLERQALPHRRWTGFDGYCPGKTHTERG
jgi:hypothetical protein